MVPPRPIRRKATPCPAPPIPCRWGVQGSRIGEGDFYGTGTTDILFRNNSTGDTWIEAISHGALAGWSQIGGSDTHYSVVGGGDVYSNGTDDILFRNNSTGDTWFEAMSNGAFADWHQVGGSDTSYVSVPQQRHGDTWIEALSNGSFRRLASGGWI
jgi:hypothetical protein